MLTCCKYEAGVVISLERHEHLPPGLGRELPCRNVGLSMVGETTYFPDSRLALRRVFTTPGDELRAIIQLEQRPEVILAGLNYWATPSAKPKTSLVKQDDPAVPRWEDEYSSVPMTAAVYYWDENEPLTLFQNGVPEITSSSSPSGTESVVAVIDGEFRHSLQVVQTIRTGQPDTRPRVITVTLKEQIAGVFSLWTYCNLLLAVGSLRTRLAAVALPMDLGVLCADARTLANPGTPWLGALPLFEECLDKMLEARARLLHDPPVLVAAAGNTVSGGRRARLAYPASLPDVIPATAIAKDILSPIVDVPAVGHLKPCLAVESAKDPDRDFAGSTSQATGLASRAIATMDRELDWRTRRPGQFGKLAELLGRWSPVAFQWSGRTGHLNWPPAPTLRRVDQSHSGKSTDSPADTQGQLLLRRLSAQFGREFVMYGSAAFVDVWLCRTRTKLTASSWRAGFGLIADWDLMHLGPRLSKSDARRVTSEVREWWEGLQTPSGTGRQATPAPPVQLRHVRDWPGRILWLQCAIPAAQLAVTTHGCIDLWDGPYQPGSDAPIEVHRPPAILWGANPQWWNGDAGELDGALIGFNLALLRTKLANLAADNGVEATRRAVPIHAKVTIHAAPESNAGKRRHGPAVKPKSHPDSRDLWFGRNSIEAGPWAARRAKRIHALIDTFEEGDLKEEIRTQLNALLAAPV